MLANVTRPVYLYSPVFPCIPLYYSSIPLYCSMYSNSCITPVFLLYSPVFPGISLNFSCIPRYPPVFPSIPLYSPVFPCIPLYSPVFPCVPRYSPVFPGISRYSPVFLYSPVLLHAFQLLISSCIPLYFFCIPPVFPCFHL